MQEADGFRQATKDDSPRPFEHLLESADQLGRGICIWCLEKLSDPRVVGRVRLRLRRLEHYSRLSLIRRIHTGW